MTEGNPYALALAKLYPQGQLYSQGQRLYHKGTMSEGVLKDTPADIPFRDPLGLLTSNF